MGFGRPSRGCSCPTPPTPYSGPFLAWEPADYSGNSENGRARAIGSTGSFRFNFHVPADAVTIDAIYLVGAPDAAGAVGRGKDVDLTTNYGNVDAGESRTTHSEMDTTSTFDFGPTLGAYFKLPLDSVTMDLQPGDRGGVFVDHKGVGGTVDYYGVAVEYSR